MTIFTNAVAGSRVVVDPAQGDIILCAGAAHGGGADLFGMGATSAAKASGIRLRPIRRLTKFVTSTSADGLKVVTNVSQLVFEHLGGEVDALDTSGDGANAAITAFAALTDAAIIAAVPATGLSDAVAAAELDAAVVDIKLATLAVQFPQRDDINASPNAVGALQAGIMPLEEPHGGTGKDSGSGDNKNRIAEIDIKVDSVAVTAQTKKLKAKWTPELGQDLNAYHNLDAEVELTGILSEPVSYTHLRAHET